MPGRVGVSYQWTPLPSVVAQAYFMTAERAQQLEQPLMDATAIIAQELDMNFEAQGRPDGWTPLAEGTLAQKLGSLILEETGALHSEAADPGSWTIGGAGGAFVAELVDALGYGGFHVEGTRFMPVRDWTYVSDEALDAIDTEFLDWVTADW